MDSSRILPCLSAHIVCLWYLLGSRSVKHVTTVDTHELTRYSPAIDPSALPATSRLLVLSRKKFSTTYFSTSFRNSSRCSPIPSPSSSNLCCLSHHSYSLSHDLNPLAFSHFVLPQAIYQGTSYTSPSSISLCNTSPALSIGSLFSNNTLSLTALLNSKETHTPACKTSHYE